MKKLPIPKFQETLRLTDVVNSHFQAIVHYNIVALRIDATLWLRKHYLIWLRYAAEDL